MLNKEVIDVLTSINGMTNSVILKFPQTVAITESQDMQVLFNVENLDSEPFEDIGLKNSLSDLLNLVKLFPDEREISMSENTINVSNGAMSSTFIVDNIALMDAYDKSVEQFTKTEEVPSVATFKLSTEDIKNIKASTGVFKDLSEVIFTSQDGDMKISLGASNKFNAKSNTFSVTTSADTSKEFTCKIPVDNFKMLPVSDYTVSIKYNSARDSYRLLMSNDTLEGFKILLAVKV